ncbi:hypothetical protein [Bradyrhizobium sp. JYMT SZCCT0180]|uniref:hypothetical protein n=1 Tax=Bradyrhizobium sp. JYMT SZCCT0180 TaxID=2807666 RepID=UPI001BA82B2F|nr:hypothetical protein [Bradyrhizobium sp. JYMT SZCCT0180]MBR1209467.1 hypothetical protein [Bradyrhizobium sp. JYMT SZCCT0180]
MDTPGTAWDIEALLVARDRGRSIGNARDLVILDWLAKGDTRPFADWIMCGHVPSREVLLALAVMMTRGDNPRIDPAGLEDPKMREIAEIFPLSIEVTGKGKRGRNLERIQRDRGIALAVAKEMAVGSSYDQALSAVTDWLPSTGVFLERDAVEKAYKAHKPKRSGTNSC